MKKNIPLTLREALENALEKEHHFYEFNTLGRNGLLKITEKTDKESPFYFEITKQDGTQYFGSYIPSSLDNMKGGLILGKDLEELIYHLKIWIKLLGLYNKPSAIFDDPITQHYYEDISSKIEILDADADFAPFNYEQQTIIMQLYDGIKTEVTKQRTGKNSMDADRILLEIEEAQSVISSETKNQAIKRLYKIAAMGMKYSYHIAKLIAEGWIVNQVLGLL